MKPAPNDPVEHVRAYLAAHADDADCISFDVFDTLVRREIAPPSQVKIPAAKSLVEVLSTHGIEETTEGCLRTRQIVARDLRKDAVSNGRDPECPIRTIFTAWLQHYLGEELREKDVDRVLQAEIEAELSVCYPAPGLQRLLTGLKKSGKRLIFISDMYLGADDIFRILEHCGYGSLFGAGYVSGDIGLSKKTGRLFQHVLNKEAVEPARLIHVGDDPTADVRMPRRLGIRACRFRDSVHEKWAARHRRLKKLSRSNPSWEGARWADMAPPDTRAATVAVSDDVYAIGYYIIGPVLTNFIHQVVERVSDDGTDIVVFPAREGFILLSIYNRLAGCCRNQAVPPGAYVCLSRQSTFLASVDRVGDREIIRGLHTRPTLRKLLNKLSLDPDRFETSATMCGIDSLDEMIEHSLQDERLRRFLATEEFETVMTEKRTRSRQLLYDYLRQCRFWEADRAAFVDVGWTGTIQESLAMAFEHRPDWPFLNGYYMGVLNRSKAQARESEKSKFHGIFYDYRHTRDRTGFTRFTELFENAARAPHPTTTGYRRDGNGDVHPVLDSQASVFYSAECSNRHFLASLQTGILDYADRYAERIPFKEHPSIVDARFLLRLVDRLIRYPSKAEARALRQLVYSNEFGGMVFIPGRTVTDVDARKGEFNQALPKGKVFNHMWREGVYADSNLPGLNALFNLYRSLVKRNF